MVRCFKCPANTRLFRKGQRLFIAATHSGRALALGRYRGRGRYIKAWVDLPAALTTFEVELPHHLEQKLHQSMKQKLSSR